MSEECPQVDGCYLDFLKSNIYKIEAITNNDSVISEKHLLDCSRSLFNPFYNFQGVYIINKNDSDFHQCAEIQQENNRKDNKKEDPIKKEFDKNEPEKVSNGTIKNNDEKKSKKSFISFSEEELRKEPERMEEYQNINFKHNNFTDNKDEIKISSLESIEYLNGKDPNIQREVVHSDISEDLSFRCIDGIKKICLPDHWFLGGEEIIDINLNHKKCTYFKCPRNHNRLILDVPREMIIKEGVILDMVVNTQQTFEFNSLTLMHMLEKEFEINNVKIDYHYLKKYYLTNGKFFLTYKNLFAIEPEPFKKINRLIYWFRIPDICKFKRCEFFKISENFKWYFDTKALIDLLELAKKRKIKKIIENYKDITKETGFNLKHGKKVLKEKLRLKLAKIPKLPKIKNPTYQNSENGSSDHNFTVDPLEEKILVCDYEIKIKTSVKMWFWIPLIISLIPIFISINTFFYIALGSSMIDFASMNVNIWTIFSFSLSSTTWILLVLNWEFLKRLQFFQQMIYKVFFIILFISLGCTLFVLIHPFILFLLKFLY